MKIYMVYTKYDHGDPNPCGYYKDREMAESIKRALNAPEAWPKMLTSIPVAEVCEIEVVE